MKIKILPQALFAFSLLIGCWLLFGGQASAATITVGGGCSIENAITSGNNDSDTGGCTGSGGYGADTINIPAGTYTRTSNVVIDDDLEIVGAGVGSTIIDSDNSYSGFVCTNSGGGLHDFILSDMKIQNTSSSSGAFPIAAGNCDLTVNDVEITNGRESSGNIYFQLPGDGLSATLDISNVYIHDTLGTGVVIQVNGDGVTNSLVASIDRLSVTRNGVSGMTVGGISTITGNTDGASTHTTDILVRNSTFVNDDDEDSFGIFTQSVAGFSGVTDTTNLTLQNLTILNNNIDGSFPASGILGGSQAISGGTSEINVTSQNVLIGNNLASSNPGNCLFTGFGLGGSESATLTSLGNNISDDNTCGFAGSGDQESVAGLLSTLGALGANGGLGETIELLDGSPAIDSGAAIAGISIDQRGISRPQGSAFDVGAFELENEDTPTDPGGGDTGGDSGSSEVGDTITVGSSSGGTTTTASAPDTGFKLLLNNWKLSLAVTLAGSALLLKFSRILKIKYRM